MFHELTKKFLEALVSVAPVAVIVIIINMTPIVNLTNEEVILFSLCAIFMVIGIGLFNFGADCAMSPMGDYVGSGLTKTGNMLLLLVVCFFMGLLITVVEPDLSVLASQVKNMMDETLLIVVVGIGVGIFLVTSVVKMVFKKSLSHILMFFYLFLFAITSLLVASGKEDFLALAFDSGGVTTGPVTVPFIMALGLGIATALGGKNTGENSFGAVAMCSVGPILAVMALGLLSDGEAIYELPDYSVDTSFSALLSIIGRVAEEVLLSLGLIVVLFVLLNVIFLKLPIKKLGQMAIGMCYTYAGLVIFLSSVSFGFMPIGYRLGVSLAEADPIIIVLFGLVLGMVVIFAEPAVHILNKQVEDVTDGTVGKKSMMIALSVGVGVSIALSLIRIIFNFSILYYLIPGYILSLGLSFFVPGIYTAIAFDSGGVASGPLTSTFILPLAIGVCSALQGESSIMTCAFGVVAMVAMTPLITIQILGFRAVLSRRIRDNIAMKRILSAGDEQIINFM